MADINCTKCEQVIKNAFKEAIRYQKGQYSTVVVVGSDIYHAQCTDNFTWHCPECGKKNHDSLTKTTIPLCPFCDKSFLWGELLE
jgi:hypothetical protein